MPIVTDWAGDSATSQSVTGYHCDVQDVTMCNTEINLSSCEAARTFRGRTAGWKNQIRPVKTLEKQQRQAGTTLIVSVRKAS